MFLCACFIALTRSTCPLKPRSQPDPYTLLLLEGEDAEEMLDQLAMLSDYGKVGVLLLLLLLLLLPPLDSDLPRRQDRCTRSLASYLRRSGTPRQAGLAGGGGSRGAAPEGFAGDGGEG